MSTAHQREPRACTRYDYRLPALRSSLKCTLDRICERVYGLCPSGPPQLSAATAHSTQSGGSSMPFEASVRPSLSMSNAVEFNAATSSSGHAPPVQSSDFQTVQLQPGSSQPPVQSSDFQTVQLQPGSSQASQAAGEPAAAPPGIQAAPAARGAGKGGHGQQTTVTALTYWGQVLNCCCRLRLNRNLSMIWSQS